MGEESFSSAGVTVLDFWRWALGDLRMNNARGYLAEFIVARAVGSTDPIRIEWGAHDVLAPDGTRIEVKSSGLLQSWGQAKLSTPRFSLTGAKDTWDAESGEYLEDATGRVDAWVFALHGCRDHELYDPLDLTQWAFWAASNQQVESWQRKSIGVTALEQALGEPARVDELEELIPPRSTAQ